MSTALRRESCVCSTGTAIIQPRKSESPTRTCMSGSDAASGERGAHLDHDSLLCQHSPEIDLRMP
eukprot:2734756-Rhodomonas_salina.1